MQTATTKILLKNFLFLFIDTFLRLRAIKITITNSDVPDVIKY